MTPPILEATEQLLPTQTINLPRLKKRLNFLPLIAVIFFTVSGGAYGLEPLVGAVGAGWAVMLVILTPLLWSLPIALMVSELSSAMPAEGGYYVWVRNALGTFWGVQEGWWTICYTAVDMAIYPVLFVNYLSYFFPSLALDENGTAAWPVLIGRWLIALTIIVIGLGINLRGADAVGKNALVNVAVVLLPFLLLVLCVIGQPQHHLSAAWGAMVRDIQHRPNYELIALGLATVLWNYCGWDNVSTFAGEVNDAQRNYPRALIMALPLTIGAYLLPLLAGIALTTSPAVWNESAGWPVIGELVAGPWLGVMIAVAALASAWSLFNSQLLYVSRLPFVMARDRWLPAALAQVSNRNGVPVTALIASCTISALFAALPFGKLVIIDILLYSAALMLEFIALLVLRFKQPELPRPFKIPGGLLMLVIISLLPMCLAAVVMLASLKGEEGSTSKVLIALALIFCGPLLYLLRRRDARGAANTSEF